MPADPTRDEPQFDRIRAVPFVRHLRLIPAKSGDRSAGGALEITTPRGKYSLPLIVKRYYLDRSMVNAVIGQIQGERKAAKRGSRSVGSGETLLLAPYLAFRPPGASLTRAFRSRTKSATYIWLSATNTTGQ
jgi:hypothetical protein